MIGFNGGLIGKKREVWGDQIIPGVWTLPEQQIAISQNYWVGSRDRFFSNVSLLLHGNGTNGSIVFTDSSSNNFTITRFGNAQISTAQSKYGGASMLFDGSGDYLGAPQNAAFSFGTADFTVEAWIYLTGNSATNLDGNRVATIFSVASSIFSFGLEFSILGNSSTTGTGILFDRDGGASPYTRTVTINKNQWYHVAVSKTSGTILIFLDGIQQGASISDSSSWGSASQNVRVARMLNSSYIQDFPGYIDDLRVTKGVGRYTSDFIPLRFEFPDSA